MTRRIVMTLALTVLAGASSGPFVHAQEKKTLPADSGATGQPSPQAVNIKVDLTITDQRDGQPAVPKTISMVIADRRRGQLRSSGLGGQMLNVDAQPHIVRDSRIFAELNFDYRAPQTEGDKAPPTLTQSIASVVEDGKPLVIAQWNETGSNRIIRVELRLSVQK